MDKNTLHTSILPSAAALLAVLAAATLCGCSDDVPETPYDTRHSISFGTAGGMVQATRGGSQTGLHTLGYDEIKVYGYKTLNGSVQNVMPGYTLRYAANSANTSVSNTTGWEYVGQGTDYTGQEQEIKFWDGNSTDYRFFGVLPKYESSLRYNGDAIDANTVVSSAGSFSLEFTGLEFMTHTSDGKYYDRNGDEVDEKDIPMYGALWQGDPAQCYGTPVQLEFVKPYALVRLEFERPEGTSTTQLGKESTATSYITFGPRDGSTLTGDGTVDISWSMTGKHESAVAVAGAVTLPTMTLGPLELTNQETRYQAWPEYLMIPTSSTVDFLCTAYVYSVNSQGLDVFDARTAVIPAEYMKWKPGYLYTYVFKITANDKLEFSHAVEVYTKWQTGYVNTVTW